MDVLAFPSSETKKRPIGIIVLSVLWTIGSIYNIFNGLNVITLDLGYLPILYGSGVHEWFRFGLPAEIVLGFFVATFGFVTLFAVYGLFTAKSWSYHLSLALPLFVIVINLAIMSLYFSAPAELGLAAAGFYAISFIVTNVILAVIVWWYLPQKHVKQYLLGSSPKLVPPTLVPPPPFSSVSDSRPQVETRQEDKKFCRYCGAENKTDAKYCEKCGRDIGH